MNSRIHLQGYVVQVSFILILFENSGLSIMISYSIIGKQKCISFASTCKISLVIQTQTQMTKPEHVNMWHYIQHKQNCVYQKFWHILWHRFDPFQVARKLVFPGQSLALKLYFSSMLCLGTQGTLLVQKQSGSWSCLQPSGTVQSSFCAHLELQGWIKLLYLA